ncbi:MULTISPECIES: hypothetical protein [Burkholderia cepacia complex]|nr:hypothetical protein [Burkholderia vietnamiensis]MBR8085210.1 hypothetical protein [Burkholderia vietnamiensis]HDR9033776.1 hypothetical protein [Burkholderia vietnamiensis]
MKGFLLYIASSVVALGAAIVLLATVQQWDEDTMPAARVVTAARSI